MKHWLSIIAVLFLLGTTLEAENTELSELIARAENGDAETQFNLGVMYDTGKEVTQDYAEAVKWYRKAAEQGYANAQSNLGLMYAKGLGVTQNYGKALEWNRKAAQQGMAEAQFNLGVDVC